MSFMLWIIGATCEDISSRVACCRAAKISGSRGDVLSFVWNVDGEVSRDVSSAFVEFCVCGVFSRGACCPCCGFIASGFVEAGM